MGQITTTIRRLFSELNNAERNLRGLRGTRTTPATKPTK